jgi:nucleoside-diphosphate-sugar epimerase
VFGVFRGPWFNKNGMNAFVTGASGFIGTHLVRRLEQDGHKVYAFVRPTSQLAELQKLPLELVYGDVRDKAALAQTFRQHPDIDTVFHLASLLTPVTVSDHVYQEINQQGTQNVLDACREINLKAFVHCSSVGVIGPLPAIPANEQTRCAPDSNYGTSKYRAEQLALAYQQQFHLPVTVARPAWVYGPGDRRTLKFFRMVAKGRFFKIGRAHV